MPIRQPGECRQPNCNGRGVYRGYCARHKSNADTRPSAAQRGYGGEWRKIREQVLRAYGIPPVHWSLYDIDHDPIYNKQIEPDHTKYKLTPKLHNEHSIKTDKYDHGFGR
jgi:hypothetical protein